jgi:hypothetical protein
MSRLVAFASKPAFMEFPTFLVRIPPKTDLSAGRSSP